MRSKVERYSEEAERAVRDIRRATRRQYSAEDKVRIVIAGLRGEDSVAELCPDGVVETVNVASPNNLRNVKVGDQIVITLTKVMAISLVKETGV